MGRVTARLASFVLVVILLILVLLMMFRSIHSHYKAVSEQVALTRDHRPPLPRRNIVIVPINGVNVSVGTNNSSQVNIFADPASVLANFRRCVLGLDTSCGSVGNLRGLNRWNVDTTLAKDIKFTERVGATFTMQFTNVFNHFQPSDPSSLTLTTPQNLGRITSSVYAARQMELGLRIHF